MSDAVSWNGQMPATRPRQQQPPQQPQRQASGGGGDLADILERVLDKGIVIAGDIQINLLDIELLTIKLRLVVASVDRAKEMGIDWWERDPTLSSGYTELEEENRRLRERLSRLEDAEGPAELDDGEVDDREVDDGEVDDGELEDGPDDEPEPAPVPRRRRARG